MSTKYNRPTGSYAGSTSLSNRTKYQDDSGAVPKVAISAAKVDGDLNYVVDALNTLDDAVTAAVTGAIPDGTLGLAKLTDGTAVSIVGRSANTTGVRADITAAADNRVLARTSSALSFTQVTSSMISSGVATSGQMLTADGTGGANFVTFSGKGIVKVAGTLKTDTAALGTTGTWTDVTGLSVSITPSSASNTILVTADINACWTSSGTPYPVSFRLVRGSTAIGIADAAGSRQQATKVMFGASSGVTTASDNVSMKMIDSPATTSSTTYKVQFYLPASSGGESLKINTGISDTDAAGNSRGTSSIIVMEIAP